MISCRRPVRSTALLKFGSFQASTMPWRFTRASKASGTTACSRSSMRPSILSSWLEMRTIGMSKANAALASRMALWTARLAGLIRASWSVPTW